MRRRRRRSRRPARTYSIGYLLARQPKSLAKHANYRAMVAHYHASAPLQHLRMSGRCYALLNNARIAPHNLQNFYRTYRLPGNPFFPLFFAIKRDYLAERERVKEARRQYILAGMRALPPDVLAQIKYLGYLERHYNAGGLSPLWQSRIFPSSKKKVDAYASHTTADWLALYRRHLAELEERYRGLNQLIADRVLACFALGIVPDRVPPARPAPFEISRQYRRLSLETHPDRGGDPSMFIEIKRARDTLVDRT
ncbi:MAG TPA: hypothetical protein VKA06_04040 [Spirochaetia bacterium]|nr:hypothetical protein [Spirochaetia bacterium]